MKEVHVECYPDGLLVSKLGFTTKKIKHGFGKSRVLKKLSRSSGSLGLVDEDPGQSKHPYEKKLSEDKTSVNLKLFKDPNGNKIIELKVKLENWILNACTESKINPAQFNLPADPHKLHIIINSKLKNYGDLLDELIRRNNTSLATLKSWLQ